MRTSTEQLPDSNHSERINTGGTWKGRGGGGIDMRYELGTERGQHRDDKTPHCNNARDSDPANGKNCLDNCDLAADNSR